MVKADYKHDYYADLEVPSNADTELIKRRFRELAKQYHPDRNPGREVDVVPKFQAIQAAHEILGDPIQKAKYDAERAKLSRPRDTVSPTFRKPAPPRRTDSGFPANGTYTQPAPQQAARRDPSATRYAPQNTPRARPQSATNSTADKFAQFARAAPQQWNRDRFEEAARAEGLRGMNAMRGQGPQTSPLRQRAPTAPKSAGADPYASPSEPSPGFPGLNRTTSQRRGGYAPNAAGADEPRSPYTHYHRSDRERPPSAGPFPNINPQPQPRPRESNSPLRQTRSFHPDEFSHLRPGLNRTSSKYANQGGERTDINTSNLGRSASVRTSPVDRSWEEHGPFGGQRTAEERQPRPRHRSHSPQARTGGAKFDYPSETSSEGEHTPPPEDRKKTPLRRPQTFHPDSDAPGLTGYFPKTNYTRIVEDSNTYHYPAPEVKAGPTRKPFANMTSPLDGHDPNANEPPFRTPSDEEIHRHNSQPQNQSPTKDGSKFSASDWHEEFDNHADMFSPPEPTNRDRRSPTRNVRATRSGSNRTYAPSKDARRDAVDVEFDPKVAGGVRHVDPGQAESKASAFQSGKLAPDFATKVNGSRRGSKVLSEEFPAFTPGSDSAQVNGDGPTPDEMDVDTPGTAENESVRSAEGPFNVTVEEEQSPTSDDPSLSPHQHVHRNHSDTVTRANGFNLDNLKQTGPFAPSDTGLKDLNDLASNLPFTSRPSETLHRTSSHTLRHLNLPRPPKVPYCPADQELSQDTWRKYGEGMTTYMHEWNKFNAAMIEHFRARQEAVTHGMYRNWVCAQGDGATAESFESSGGADRAGYATYMTWLEDDRKCRTWWDVAFEEHRICMEGLGRVRRRVKELNSRTS